MPKKMTPIFLFTLPLKGPVKLVETSPPMPGESTCSATACFDSGVAGLTVVTGRGETLKLNKSLIKNASGYDLRQLFIGSEGTLGFVTEASLFVTTPPRELSVFLFSVPQLEAMMEIYEIFSKNLPLTAYEMFTDLALKKVLQHNENQNHTTRFPLTEANPYYVLLEVEHENSQTLEKAMECFETCSEKSWITDGTCSQNSQQAREFWKFRENISEALSTHSPHKNDISVSVSQIPHFLKEMNTLLEKDYPQYKVIWFGHIGDGNLHINILKPHDQSSEDFLKKCKEVDEKLFATIKHFDGSISAEHGVGLTKKPFLTYTRSQEEIQLMREVKKVFDPDGIMNPGKIFDL